MLEDLHFHPKVYMSGIKQYGKYIYGHTVGCNPTTSEMTMNIVFQKTYYMSSFTQKQCWMLQKDTMMESSV